MSQLPTTRSDVFDIGDDIQAYENIDTHFVAEDRTRREAERSSIQPFLPAREKKTYHHQLAVSPDTLDR